MVKLASGLIAKMQPLGVALWSVPETLPSELRLEWRLVGVRWLGLACLFPGLFLFDLNTVQRLTALVIALLASIYNLGIWQLLRRRPALIATGFPTAIGDTALNASMLLVLGGFSSQFSYCLFPFLMSLAVRFGHRVSLLGTTIVIVTDGLSNLFAGTPPDKGFLFRNLFLLLTVVLASFMRDRAERAYAEVAATAAENARLYAAAQEELAERRVLEQQLAQQATHDDLTGLPNRALFRERLEQVLVSSRRDGQQYAVFFIDLDHFKDVNDSWGHDTGDRLLVAATGRLRSCLRDADTLARLGGDEFAVLLPDVGGGAEVVQTAAQLLAALAAPLALTGPDYAVTASIGIVLASGQYGRPEDVLRHADVALYRAKETGRAGYKVFDPEMQAALTARLDLERDLRQAIKGDEFVLHYQPIVDLHTERIVAAEALLRWQHPTRGMVAPLEFIPLAEETGMIHAIDRWVLRAACQQAYAWYQQDPGDAPLVSVNLSPLTFRLPELGAMVAATLAAVGLPAGQLKLEITEGTAMENAVSTVATLGELKGLGVRLAIDDFGTGYSSLAYLKRFPIDTLKIDKAFVDGLGQDADDTAIVRTVLTLAHSLSLQVTAEGLETVEQLRFLRTLGCEYGQGYHFSRPLPADAFAAFRARASLTLPRSLLRD